MANGTEGRNRHFILEGVTETEAYRYPGGGNGGGSGIPERDRDQHATALRSQVGALRPIAEGARAAQEDAGMTEGLGVQVEFRSFPDIELAFESLARERSGIELLNVRHQDDSTRATKSWSTPRRSSPGVSLACMIFAHPPVVRRHDAATLGAMRSFPARWARRGARARVACPSKVDRRPWSPGLQSQVRRRRMSPDASSIHGSWTGTRHGSRWVRSLPRRMTRPSTMGLTR